jgi:hypothetical protein
MTYKGIWRNGMAFPYLVRVVIVRGYHCAEDQRRSGNCCGPELHGDVCSVARSCVSRLASRQEVQQRNFRVKDT